MHLAGAAVALESPYAIFNSAIHTHNLMTASLEPARPQRLVDYPSLELRGTVQACGLVSLPRIHDPRGNLTFIEAGTLEQPGHVPFGIERVYYLYDVPGGAERGGHAHLGLYQFIIAMSGSFDITLDDGTRKVRYHLNRSYEGLYVCPMIWREIDNFSSGSVCVVLASARYDEGDYLRDYDDFLARARR